MGSVRDSGTTRSRRFGILSSIKKAKNAFDHGIDSAADEWVQQTQNTARTRGDLKSDGAEDDYYALAQLRSHTDAYVKKKGHPSPDQCTNLLTQLIRRHPEKDIAFLACAHGMTREDARQTLVGEFQLHSGQTPEAVKYLRVLLAARQVKPELVDDSEAQWAECLLSLSTSTVRNVGQRLEAFVATLSTGFPGSPLLHSLVDQVPRDACFQLSNHLEHLRQEVDFGRAYAACAWMSRLHQTSKLIVVLNEVFPRWKIWAEWRPNPARLRIWECMTLEQRNHISKLLSLEGPDVLTGRNRTLREGLALQENSPEIHIGIITIKVQTGLTCDRLKLLDQLLDALGTALSVSSNGLLYFTQLCLDRAVTCEELRLLEAANVTGNSAISASVLQLLSNHEAVSIQMTAISQLLPALSATGTEGDVLRELISPIVVNTATLRLKSLQDKLRKQTQSGQDVEMDGLRTAELAHSLKNAIWLQPKLDQCLQAFLSQLPSIDMLKALFKVQNIARDLTIDRSSPLTQILDSYCMAHLVDCSSQDSETTGLVEALLPFWMERPDRERREAALTLIQRHWIPSNTRADCLLQLKEAPEKLVHIVGSIGDTNTACVQFAKVLSSSKVYNTGFAACWRHLLLATIENRGPELAEKLFEQVRIEDWFRWQDDLRKIFSGGTARPASKHLIFQRSFYRWSDRISRDYLSSLKRIDQATSHGPALKWVALRLEDAGAIAPILHTLKSLPEGTSDPVVHVILANLKPSGSNAKLITDALSRLVYITKVGMQASLHVVEGYNQNSKRIPDGLVALILKSEDLAPADERALKAVVAVLEVCTSLPKSYYTSVRSLTEDASADMIADIFLGMSCSKHSANEADNRSKREPG